LNENGGILKVNNEANEEYVTEVKPTSTPLLDALREKAAKKEQAKQAQQLKKKEKKQIRLIKRAETGIQREASPMSLQAQSPSESLLNNNLVEGESGRGKNKSKKERTKNVKQQTGALKDQIKTVLTGGGSASAPPADGKKPKRHRERKKKGGQNYSAGQGGVQGAVPTAPDFPALSASVNLQPPQLASALPPPAQQPHFRIPKSQLQPHTQPQQSQSQQHSQQPQQHQQQQQQQSFQQVYPSSSAPQSNASRGSNDGGARGGRSKRGKKYQNRGEPPRNEPKEITTATATTAVLKRGQFFCGKSGLSLRSHGCGIFVFSAAV
jgi:hypothetical protein